MKLLFINLFLEGGLNMPSTEDFLSKVIPNLWAFLVQLFAFIIMVLIAIKFGYKPVKKFLDSRKAYIANNLEEAKSKNEEANRNLEETKAKLQGSEKEAIQIIQEAKKAAEAEREQILEETKKDIATKHQKAQEDIRIEQEKVMKEMHDDVVDIAIEATKNILNREVSSGDDKALLDNFVSDLIDEKNQSKSK